MGRPGPDLVPDQHDVARADGQSLEGGPHRDRRHRDVGTARHRDRILPIAIHEDQRDPRRLTVERDEPGHIDAIGLEGGSRLCPERIVAHRPDEVDGRSKPGRRDRLVTALAAVVARISTADDGLAGDRQPLDADHLVHVDRPDDDDPTAHGAHVVVTSP